MPDNSTGAWDVIVTPWHLDEHIPDFPVPVGAVATIGPPLPDGAVPSRVNVLHQAVAHAVAGAARPLLLSGDCPAGLAMAAGLQPRHGEIAVVWLDAHGDFNTPAITISGYLGGMAVAMLTGRAPELFADPLGLRPVPEHNIVLADARDLDPAERDALAGSPPARTSSRHPSPAPGSPARSAGRPRERRSPGWPARSAPGSPGHQETRRLDAADTRPTPALEPGRRRRGSQA